MLLYIVDLQFVEPQSQCIRNVFVITLKFIEKIPTHHIQFYIKDIQSRILHMNNTVDEKYLCNGFY